jgi:hypothetical protein
VRQHCEGGQVAVLARVTNDGGQFGVRLTDSASSPTIAQNEIPT